MEIIYIIIGVAILIFIFKGKNKKRVFSESFDNNTIVENKFPDRTDSPSFFEKAILKSIDNGDFESANLNFAKLIESFRQQEIINKSKSSKNDLEEAKALYEDFRKKYSLEYPNQFLPPKGKKKQNEKLQNEYLLLTTLNYEKLPPSILKNIDKIKTIENWGKLKFNPKKEKYGKRWKSIKRQNRYFDFKAINPNSTYYKAAIGSEYKITRDPYCILALISQGCELEEFLHGGEDILFLKSALEKQENNDLEGALEYAHRALKLKNQKAYTELISEIEITRNRKVE